MGKIFVFILFCVGSCYCFSLDEMDSFLDYSQVNLTGCGWACSLDDFMMLGPPPDMILSMPPPPLPPFLQKALLENSSEEDNAECNFCHLFRNPSGEDSGFTLPKPAVKPDSWLSLLVATVLGSTVFGALLLVFLFKCKKWKIFPMTDSCPILPEGFLGGHKSAPPPCSPTDPCISPVVNEKSPQSIITEAPSKKTSISSKYWRRDPKDIHQVTKTVNSLDGNTELDEHYDPGSCTSSPVYAELDAAGVNNSHIPTPIIINGPSQSISPYAVHTYSEVADALRMAALTSSSALLPDASYDNAAYLPSSNSDHYHSRSLRRLRGHPFAQLGSTTPLLASHHHLNQFNGSVNYLTGARPLKKPRGCQQLPRSNILSLQDDLESSHIDRQPRLTHGRRQHGMYSDYQINSPGLTTFRVPHVFREPKRPLPPVPGVRL